MYRCSEVGRDPASQSLPEPLPSGSGPGPCRSVVPHLISVTQRISLTRGRRPVPPWGDAQPHPLAGSGSEPAPQPVRRKKATPLLGCPHLDRRTMAIPAQVGTLGDPPQAHVLLTRVHHSVCRKHRPNQCFSGSCCYHQTGRQQRELVVRGLPTFVGLSGRGACWL